MRGYLTACRSGLACRPRGLTFSPSQNQPADTLTRTENDGTVTVEHVLRSEGRGRCYDHPPQPIFLSPLVLPEKERPIAMALWASTRPTRLLLPAAACCAACRVPTLLLAQSSRLHVAPTSHTAHLALLHRVEKHAVTRRPCSMQSQWGHESESGL